MGKFLPQLMLTTLCNFGSFFMGLQVGWIPSLTENREYNQLKWLASLPVIAIFFSAPLIGFLLQRFGRKRTLLITIVPNIVVYGIPLITDFIYFRFIAFAISGYVSAGALIVTPFYVSECVEERWRGFLGGLAPIFINIGTSLALFVRPSVDITMFNWTIFVLTLMALISFLWLPESPVYLASVNDLTAAEKNLRKLGRQAEEAEQELAVTSASLNVAAECAGNAGLLRIFRDPGLRRGLIFLLVVLFMQQFSGTSPINFSELGFRDDGYKVVVVAGCLHVVGSIVAPVLLHYYGRRTILLYSGCLMTLALAGLFHLVILNALYLLRQIAFAVFILAYNCGPRSVPYVLLPDIVPPGSRGVVPAIAFSAVSLFVFTATLGLNFLRSYAWKLFWLSGCAVFGTLFVFLGMVETRGISVRQVYDVLSGKTQVKQEVVIGEQITLS